MEIVEVENITDFQPKDREQRLSLYVENLPDKILQAKNSQACTLKAKYHNLSLTMKPFRDLALKHRKQLSDFIRQLEQDYHIDRLSSESNYYKNHVDYLEKLHSNFDEELAKKKQVEAEVMSRALESRKKLGALKLENIELAMAIQKKRQKMGQHQPAKEPKQRARNRPNEEASLLRETLEAEQELFAAEKVLLERIASRTLISELVWSSFEQLRLDLEKNQKIVHNQGLAGSMLFKLTTAHNKENCPVAKLPVHHRRMDGDLKFLVYDSLRRKYNSVKREKARASERYEVSESKFSGYTSMQVTGLMELRPDSIKLLQQQLLDRRKQLLQKYSEY